MSKGKPADKSAARKLRVRDYTKERKKWVSKVTPEDYMVWAASGEPERLLSELKAIQAKKRKRKAA